MEKEKSRYIEEKLNKIIVKDGYVPSRGKQSYFIRKDGVMIKEFVNCMGHACFNLRNEQFFDYDICSWEDGFYFNEMLNPYLSLKANADNMKDFIKHIGLKVENSSPKYKLRNWNSWKVALYFDDYEDYHYLLQENDRSWSSKCGSLGAIKYFDKLPRKYDFTYKLYDCFTITNPKADANNKYIMKENLTCGAKLLDRLREKHLCQKSQETENDFEM